MAPGDFERYSRQIAFPGIGKEGQQKLLDATVAVVGCGALGSFLAGALARAGVGCLRIVDRDYVELNNLQRQWLFDESDASQALPKAIAAARKIVLINSGIHVEPLVADLTSSNATDLLDGAALILDGTDNFEARFLLNDYSVSRGVPWIYGAAVGGYGVSMTIAPPRTACLRCVYPEPPEGAQPTCETAGVLGAVTSLIASLQAAEALKLLCGLEPSPNITTADLWTGNVRQVRRPARDPDCKTCARRDFEYLSGARTAPVSLCGRDAVQIHERARPVDLRELAARLAPLGPVRSNDFALRFEAPPYLLTVFPDGRAIIKGTTDIGLARGVYARYVGA